MRDREQEIKELNEKMAALQQEDEGRAAECARRSQRVKKENQELQAELSEARGKVQAAVARSEEVAHEVERIKREMKEKEAEFAKARAQQSDNHQEEMATANQRIASLVAETNSLLQQIAGFEATLTSVKQQRRKLGRQIERLEIANAKLKDQIETQAVKLRAEGQDRIQEVGDEKDRQIRELELRICDTEVLNAKLRQLMSEIATLTVAKRSVELKNRALEERIQLEKKTVQSQASAQVNAVLVEYSGLSKKHATEIEDALQDLSALLDDDMEATDFKSVLAAVIDQFEQLRTVQVSFNDLAQQVGDMQKLLNVDSPPKVLSQIRRLTDLKSATEKRLSELEDAVAKSNQEREQLLKDMKKASDQVSGLKIWENWSQRVYRVVHGPDAVELRGKDLRQVLEEALVASASQQSLTSKVQILREEKAILLKFDRKVLTAQQQLRAVLRPIVAVFVFACRVQRIAGRGPMAVAAEIPEQLFLRPLVQAHAISTSRKRGRSVQRATSARPCSDE
jgi:chromosome segregation ATPase